jgi:hypothetical protein
MKSKELIVERTANDRLGYRFGDYEGDARASAVLLQSILMAC